MKQINMPPKVFIFTCVADEQYGRDNSIVYSCPNVFQFKKANNKQILVRNLAS